ncbi:MAG TPA: PaeR7I family type II restriction endonuclease, partial [bacterium]
MGKIDNLSRHLSEAIAHYWQTRQAQSRKQVKSGRADQGARSAVTGGAQMDGFIGLINDLIMEAGADVSDIFCSKHLELPGFFRPTKEWDL